MTLDGRRVALSSLCTVAGWAQLAVARSSMQGRAARGTRMAGGGADTRHAAMCTTASSPAQNFGAVTESMALCQSGETPSEKEMATREGKEPGNPKIFQ